MKQNEANVYAIRHSVFGKEMREPICRSIENSFAAADQALDGLEDSHDERTISMEVVPLSKRSNYSRLVITRAGD